MTAKHTPGPWAIFHYEEGLLAGLNYIAADTDPEDPIVTVCRGESEANARLIASAPALLDALKPFMDPENHLRFMGDKDGRFYLSVTAEEYAAGSAALAQAEG